MRRRPVSAIGALTAAAASAVLFAAPAAAAPNAVYHKTVSPDFGLWGFSDEASCWQHLAETFGPHLSSIEDCQWRANSGIGPDRSGRDPGAFYIYTNDPSPA
ncbi:hypothetical protein OG921_24430 [Aldersonia sp. NBC_00410]|uniref:hypothetical protein n=1 Tax=Aldersonia sp. NBC_00410 TaxID=2975954 RepID=UPI0022528A54|nr:hypothetical protein [Aldersonia sp. NBC_00410]MCX5044837.1 hypothetical protein [Aldersonia sp. NBC_00410]MCX5046324.1 hypothetical protein [Aldersonia sp. NBC_00410]